MDLCSLPIEVLLNTFEYLDVRSTLNISETCKSLEAISNDERLWVRHTTKLIGPAVEDAPPGLLAKLREAPQVTNPLPRASPWRVTYAQIRLSSMPDQIVAEQNARTIRKRTVQLVLSEATLSSPESSIEGAPDNEHPISEVDRPLLKMLQNVRYIPIRIALFGDAKIGKTSCIVRYLRSREAIDEPFRPELLALLQPSADRFGSFQYSRVEKGSGNIQFHVTLIDPPNDNEAAQVAALRGVDSVLIAFACNNVQSVRSVGSHWVPFVRKWLGPNAPITLLGLKVDQGFDRENILEALSTAGIPSFDLFVHPYERTFWRNWTN